MTKIGTEYREIQRGRYVHTARGNGTHVWNGKRIVSKAKYKETVDAIIDAVVTAFGIIVLMAFMFFTITAFGGGPA